jgi:hypothetical protein
VDERVWRRIGVHHAVIILVAALSHNIQGAWLEFFRSVALVIAVTALYRILGRETVELWSGDRGILAWYAHLNRREKTALYVFTVAVCIYIVLVAPGALARAHPTSDHDFMSRIHNYYVPYAVYLPYALVNYILLGVPLIIVLLRSVRRDIREGRALDRRISGMETAVDGIGAENISTSWARYREAIVEFELDRRKVGAKYVLCVTIFMLYFFLELLTVMHKTLLHHAEDAMKLVVWVFAIAAFAGIIRLLARYHSRNSKAEVATRNFAVRASAVGALDVNRTAVAFEQRLAGDLATMAFGGRLLKSGSFAAFVFSIALAVGIAALKGKTLEAIMNTMFPSFIAALFLSVLEVLGLLHEGAG